MNILALTGMAVVLFTSTNIDDIFLLVGFFADARIRGRDIVLGQYAGIMALFCVSLAIGGKKLFDLYRQRDRPEAGAERRPEAGAGGRATAVAMVTMANGGDNIVIYTPLFAIRSAWEIAVIGLIFVAMIALWCFLARALVNHPRLGPPIRRYGHVLSPIVLIALGVLILYQAGSLGLFRG